MNHLSKFLRDLFTEDDEGVTWSLMHVAAGAAIATGLGLAVWDVAVLGHAFKLTDFGLGAGSVLGGSGAAIFANSRSGTK